MFSRFKSKLVRRLASGTFIVRNAFMLGITLYTPCVALNTVANIPYWASYLLMTVLGILFTIFVSEEFSQFWRFFHIYNYNSVYIYRATWKQPSRPMSFKASQWFWFRSVLSPRESTNRVVWKRRMPLIKSTVRTSISHQNHTILLSFA